MNKWQRKTEILGRNPDKWLVSTTDLTQQDPFSNSDRRAGKPATNHMI
jgi:hypothetical protein